MNNNSNSNSNSNSNNNQNNQIEVLFKRIELIESVNKSLQNDIIKLQIENNNLQNHNKELKNNLNKIINTLINNNIILNKNNCNNSDNINSNCNSYNNNIEEINSCSNSYNNDIEYKIEDLFFKVWRNIVLNGEIFKHYRLFNKNREVGFKSIEELVKYNERDYILKLVLKRNAPIESSLFPSYSFLETIELLRYERPLPDPKVFPKSVTSLLLHLFNQPLTKNSIPSHISKLWLRSFNHPLEPGVLPEALKELTLIDFNQVLTKGSLPSSLRYLFLNDFNHLLPYGDECIIPDSVTSLTLNSYDYPIIETCLPSSITYCSLDSYNQPLLKGSIPSSVTELYLDYFNQKLYQYSIPNSVKELYIHSYSKSLKYLPHSINTLSLTNYIPSQIISIPSSITHLTFNYQQHDIEPGSLPLSIKKLVINGESFRNVFYFGPDEEFKSPFYFKFYPTKDEIIDGTQEETVF